MRIPHIIDENTRLAYGPSEEAKSVPIETKRKIKAEDTEWDVNSPPSLINICARLLPAVLAPTVPCDIRNFMLETLPLSLPLSVATKSLQDGVYWKRRTLKRWPDVPPNVQDTDGSWKQYFMEKHVQEYLESLPVEAYDVQEVEDLCCLAKDFVRRLELRELQIQKQYYLDDDEDGSGAEEPKDRIDLKPIFSGLQNLTEFHLQFGVRNVGTNYKKSIVQFTLQDCRNIGKGVAEAVNLQVIRIHHSELDDAKIIALLSHMQPNNTLQSLNFSHCRLGDEGAAALAKFISQRKSVRKLDICNNKIKAMGVKALAFVLTQEPACELSELILRLNTIGDEGAKYLFSALTRKSPKIRKLDISCTGLGEDSGVVLGEVVSRNESLVDLNISNNKLGKDAGEVILREMVGNTNLQFLDLRMTGVQKEIQLQLEALLHINRCRNRLVNPTNEELAGDTSEAFIEKEI